MKYLIKLLILSIIGGILLTFMCNGSIPIEYKRIIFQVYMLGMLAGAI